MKGRRQKDESGEGMREKGGGGRIRKRAVIPEAVIRAAAGAERE